MLESKSDDDLVDQMAEEFAHRWRQGDKPSIEEYARRYPQWDEKIRAVLCAVELLEQLKPCREDGGHGIMKVPLCERPLERVGEYRIVRIIGRGGMGVVYEADQETLGRRVAIKVLPAHLLADDKLRARFHRESRAAARLHHTNIVPVFEVGEHEGLCFYVMQLIPGCGLDQLIRQAAGSWATGSRHAPPLSTQSIAAAPTPHPMASPTDEPAVPGDRPTLLAPERELGSRTPSLRCSLFKAAARVGVQVAEALAYAHSQGILHRDIKPSNLLVDNRDTIWITDFGVAKLVEEANLTQSGDLVGTLKYMPPERFSGHSDVRGDVYSLGVTLYELITLRPAFPDTTPHHIIHLITHQAPLRPRKLNTAIPLDLETIVLKALARDPEQRYQTATELAEDLRRFLDDRPILARRTPLAEQGWRWCRRNPLLAGAMAASFLLMVAITVISVIASSRTTAASLETAKALAAEKTQREQAEATATLALDALNRTYDRFAPARLVVTPQPTNEEGIELPPQPALLPEAVPLLEDLLRTYGAIARSGGELPRLRAQAAEANLRIGDITQRLGRFEEAVVAYRTSIDLYESLIEDSAEDALRIKLARGCNEMGRTLRILHQPEEARQMHERAIRLLSDGPSVLTRRPECRYELARSYCSLGLRDKFLTPGRSGSGRTRPQGPHLRRAGFPPHVHGDGETPAQLAAALLEELVHDYPSVPEYRHLLACCYRDIPQSSFEIDRSAKQSNAAKAIRLLRRLVEDHPRVPDYRFDLCETLVRLGSPSRPGNRSDDSSVKERLEEAIKLSVELMAQYHTVPEYSAAHARYLDALGMALFREGQLVQAEKRHREAVALQAQLVKQFPDIIAYRCWLSLMERSLGRTLRDRGQLQEARTLLEVAINRVEELIKKDARLVGLYPFLEHAYSDLAVTLTRSGEPQQAAAAQARAEQYEMSHHLGSSHR